MALLIAIDSDTMAAWDGEEVVTGTFEEMIQRTADKHNELLVFNCEMPRFRSTPDTLAARGQESVPPGTVYTTRKIDEQTYQAFAVPIETIRTLRDLGYRGIIAPYAVALQNAVANTVVGFMEQQHTVIGPAPTGPEALIVLDTVGDDILMSVVAEDDEVVAARRLISLQDLRLEILRTLQEVRISTARIVTNNHEISVLTGAMDLLVRLLKTQEPLVCVGTQLIDPYRLRLAEEIAEERRFVVRRKRMFRFFVAIGIAGAMLLAVMAAQGRNLAINVSLNRQTTRRDEVSRRLEKVFHMKYATSVEDKSQGAASLWFELSVSLPPQLEVQSVELTPTMRKAELEHRQDIDATPITRGQIETILGELEAWNGSQIREVFTPQSVTFVVEKIREPIEGGSK